MRRFSNQIFVFALLLLPVFAEAQQIRGVCGTHPDATIDRLDANLEAISKGFVRTRGAVTYLPIKYHLVAKTDGSGRVTEENVLSTNCKLNEQYLDQDIQFYIKDGFNYINNDAVYTNHVYTQGTIMNLNKDRAAINVFIVDNATPGAGTLGTTLGYFSPDRDWIVLLRTEANKSSQTLSHEMGHFLSLAHPHRGWDAQPFSNTDPSWPKAPAIASDGATATEKMDGSNCSTAADKLCDTPPDYNFGFGWPPNSCVYNGGATDPNGVVVDPDETLVMSYFDNSCVNKFSPMQKTAIAADVASAKRAHLRLGYTPPATTVSSNGLVAVYPKSNEVIAYSPSVTIDWEDILGATNYIFEITDLPGFTSTRRFFTTSSSVTVDNITANRRHTWRVRPYNPYYTCAGLTTTYSFTPSTSVATNEIPSVKNFALSPNPQISGQDVWVTLESSESLATQVNLYNVEGQLLSTTAQILQVGENNFALPTSSLQPGLFFLHVRSEKGILKSKFVIVQ
jgi:hypothetical protein